MLGAHFMLGEIDIFHAQLDDGIAEMGKEIEVNPNYAMAWYRLGEVLTHQERWSAAIPNLERAIWLNSDFSGPYIVLGKCYVKTANYANAESILRHALTLDPNNSSSAICYEKKVGLRRARFHAALRLPDDVYQGIELGVNLLDGLLMAGDEFSVLFHARGGFGFQVRHNDKRVFEFPPCRLKVCQPLLVIVKPVAAVGFRHAFSVARRR